MYVTRLRSMEHLSANISTHCVDGGRGGVGWGDGIGVGVQVLVRNRMMWNCFSLSR